MLVRYRCYRFFFFILVFSFCSACGFRLRGVHSLPFTCVFITGITDPVVESKLVRLLNANKVSVMRDKEMSFADARLDLNFSKTRSAVNVTNLEVPQEFILTTTLHYVLKSLPSNAVIASGIISSNRAMSYSTSYALAKEVESKLLYRDMSSEVIDQLIWRLSAPQPYNMGEEMGSTIERYSRHLPLPPP